MYSLYDYVWRNRDPTQHFYLVNSETKQKMVDLNIPVSILAPDNDLTVFVTDMWVFYNYLDFFILYFKLIRD